MTPEEERLKELEEIKDAAAECRILQRVYFRNRNGENLLAAKRMEQRLDHALIDHMKKERLRRGI